MKDIFTGLGYRYSAYGEEDAPILILHHGDEEEDYSSYEDYFKAHQILFIKIQGNKWERDFSPFPCSKVFRGGKDFQGGAESYRKKFVSEVVPFLLVHYSLTPDRIILSGYSLAGLFALYASQCSLFTDINSVSGSLWFPDYVESLKMQKVYANNIYLSIGDRESVSRSPILQTGVEKQKKAYQELVAKKKNVTLVLEKGGHFDNPEKRVLHGIEWLFKQK
ncbi:MAG: alpha/beta hydrolase-fold protein [Eubacteriales bacterium]|nr:alpha/beta hydrolase-fold protein [Eubacteriales bacterium]